MVLDASTEPDYEDHPVVELDGSSAWNVTALTITGGDSLVRGFAINRYELSALTLSTRGNNRVEANYLGTDAAGEQRLGNFSGVTISTGSGQNVIGGTQGADTRNILSGNGHGLVISRSPGGNLVHGNYIGTSAAGSAPIGNGNGILISDSSYNTIGGNTAATRNVISGNTVAGILIRGDTTGALSSGPVHSYDNVVSGNYIGTNAAARFAIANRVGVAVRAGSSFNRIGGTTTPEANIIVGSEVSGIEISGNVTLVQHNFIGTTLRGGDLGNEVGVHVLAEASNTTLGPDNTIAFNKAEGVVSESRPQGLAGATRITENAIFSNGELGIDIGGDGLTVNAPIPQNMKYPDLESAASDGTTVTIEATLRHGFEFSSTQFTVEYFASEICDPSGNGEGKRFVGRIAANAMTGGTSSVSGSFIANVAPGQFITATATRVNANDTSEFSECFEVQRIDVPPPPLRKDTFDGTESDGKFETTTLDPPVMYPGLAGFGFDFEGDVAYDLSAIAAGFFDAPRSDLTLEYHDTDYGEPYDWVIDRQDLPPGTRVHRSHECNEMGGFSMPLPVTAPRTVAVLLGFGCDYQTANRPLNRLEVRLFGGFVEIIYRDRSAGERYCYTVDYGLVPSDRVRETGVLIEQSDGGDEQRSLGALNIEQPVLRGVDLQFHRGDYHLDRVKVRLVPPGSVQVAFTDQHDNADYSFRVWWADLK